MMYIILLLLENVSATKVFFIKQSLDSLMVLVRLVVVFLQITSNVADPPEIKVPDAQFYANF